MSLPGQLDLFAAPVAPAPPTAMPPQAGAVHWIVITTKRARTACGRLASTYRMRDREAVDAETGEIFACWHDGWSPTITCSSCLEVR